MALILGGGGGGFVSSQLDYVEGSGVITVSGATDAAATTVITSNSVTFDGTAVIVEFYSPDVDVANVVGAQVVVTLWQDATDLGRIGFYQNVAAQTLRDGVYLRRRLTPSAAAHTFIVKAWQSGGNGAFQVGAGGTGVNMPMSLRITRA